MTALPPEFVRWLRDAYLRWKDGNVVFSLLIQRWRNWCHTGSPEYAIPGYHTPPPAGPAGYPVAWSPSQLARLRPTISDLPAVPVAAPAPAGASPTDRLLAGAADNSYMFN